MKKLSLRIRFTLVASLFLFLSCVSLTLLSGMSAEHMVKAVRMVPVQGNEMPFMELEPSESEGCSETLEPYYHKFQSDIIVATFVIVLLGSAAVYFAAGYALRPICVLSKEVQRRNANNLGDVLELPQSFDEVRELTLSFNRMLEDLQKAFILQKQFSANAAHELRTPLAVMRTKLDVFVIEHSEREDVKELADSMGAQLDRLSELIEDLLWFSQDLPLEKTESISLYPLFCDVAEELSGLAAGKEIAIQIEETDCKVLGQDSLLERVFYNLLENAVKYSPEKTCVSIMTREEKNGLKIKICDQGEGIPKEYEESVFEPFFRVDKSRSRAVGGNGLGLAVCKKILERHHAAIHVYANHPAGSVFEITFPA